PAGADAPRGLREQEADEPARLRGNAGRTPARGGRGRRCLGRGDLLPRRRPLPPARVPARPPARGPDRARDARRPVRGVRVPRPRCRGACGRPRVETLVSRRFVLLDRDGPINEEIGYVLRPDELRLIPGAGEALRELRGLGLGLVVLTNQSPIGRGMLTVAGVAASAARLGEMLAALGVRLDGIEFCPHLPDEGCSCRKPGTLMVERAARALGFDPGEAWLVGDHGSRFGPGLAARRRTDVDSLRAA